MHLNRDEFAHAQRAAEFVGTHGAITGAALPASAEQMTGCRLPGPSRLGGAGRRPRRATRPRRLGRCGHRTLLPGFGADLARQRRGCPRRTARPARRCHNHTPPMASDAETPMAV